MQNLLNIEKLEQKDEILIVFLESLKTSLIVFTKLEKKEVKEFAFDRDNYSFLFKKNNSETIVKNLTVKENKIIEKSKSLIFIDLEELKKIDFSKKEIELTFFPIKLKSFLISF